MRSLCRLVILLFAFLYSSIGAHEDVKSTESFAGNAASSNNPTPPASAKALEVIQLTSRNFGKHLSDGNVWLIEFYSPNCGHCVEFAPTYAEIAKYYHGSDAHKIKVGKVNGEFERALVSRFGIYAYPSIYIVDGWSVYQFQQPRSKKLVMSFAEGGYKRTASISFYASPMGPLGLLQGLLISAGHSLSDFFVWAQRVFGLSPLLVGMILFGSLFLGCFFLIVFLALAIPPRQKRD
jgi:thiol-disulfide isomerase/thioredoxin